jgi:hypothetical protein
LVSLSSSFAFNSSISFDDVDEDAEWPTGFAGVLETPVVPDIVESLFLASVTAALLAGLAIGVDRLVVPEAPTVPVVLAVVLDTVGLTVCFGLGELVDTAGFRTVDVDGAAFALLSAAVSGFAEEW